MTNEQIFEEINSRKEKIRNILSNSNNFELNADIVRYRKEINDLRKECSHINSNYEKMTRGGRCIYCGTEVK